MVPHRADKLKPAPGLNRFKPWFKPAGLKLFKPSWLVLPKIE